MRILVDGNNVMGALAAECVDAGRSMLCGLLERFAERVEGRVTVVFDGPPRRGESAQQAEPSRVTVLYGADRTADDVVIDHLRADSAPRRLTVVSSDRQIRREARKRRCRIVRAEPFARWLLAPAPEPSQPDEPPAKLHGLADEDDAARWLEQFDLSDGGDIEPGG